MLKRKSTIAIALILLLAIAGYTALRLSQRSPKAARLLPEADGIVYAKFSTIRMFTGLGKDTNPAKRDPEYNQFVEETGFDFERDLDQAALAIHTPVATANAGRNAPTQRTRFSWVLVGRYDRDKVHEYFRKRSSSVLTHRDVEIFQIPLEGRTLRVALLSNDTVAVSNHDAPEMIEGVIDRYTRSASPYRGPKLLDYYKEVPSLSTLWGIVKLPTDKSPNPLLALGGWSMNFPENSVAVLSASVAPTSGNVQVRADMLTGDEASSKRVADQLGSLLSLYRNVSPGGNEDPAMKAFTDSVTIEEKKDRTSVTASVPEDFFRSLTAEATAPPPPTPAPPAEASTQKSAKKRSRR